MPRVVDPFASGRYLTRRHWLRIGSQAALGCLGAALLCAPRASANGDPRRGAGFGRARSVIVVFANGGQSQLDTWDPKPEAPDGIRGEFKAIETAVPGTFLSEHMPRLARLADHYTIVRSVSHDDLDHGSAAYLALTGQFHPRKSSNPPPAPGDMPTYGAILKRVRQSERFPHTAIHVNGPALVPERPAPGQDGGFLGREFEPLVVGDVSETPVVLPSLAPLPELSAARLEARRGLLASLDSRGVLKPDQTLTDLGNIYSQAYALLASPGSRAAFDLSAETPATHERYGRHRSGQACLLARRLVEAGVPLVTVMFNHSGRGQDKESATDAYGWDTHNDIFPALREHLLPRFDHSFSALLEDLEVRGLLEQTLVLCLGEFGRAPRIALEPGFAGNSPGRKHWAGVYSVVMAGAGVARGAIHGASDRIGARPADSPVSPTDLAATLFWALGIDPGQHYRDPLGRPFAISAGRPMTGLWA